MMTKKIGVFGGSFDPIHFGHLKPVIETANTLGLSEVIYMPCFQQPLKNGANIDAEHRLNMCNLAIQSTEILQVKPTTLTLITSDYEIQQQGQSYTVNTLRYLKSQLVDSELFFIVGLDSLLNFHKWFLWREILQIARLVVMVRPGYQLDEKALHPDVIPYLRHAISLVNNAEHNISSTTIRSRIDKSIDVTQLTDFMPKTVCDYLDDHNLYK